MWSRAIVGGCLLVAGAGHAAGAQSGADARQTVSIATHVVDTDTAPRLVARWRNALARDPSDRLAALGLATISRLEFRYRDADSRFRALLPSAGAPEDGVSVYARLGLALGRAAQSAPGPADTAFDGAAVAARAIGDSAALVQALLGVATMRAVNRSRAEGLAVLREVSRVMPSNEPALQAAYRCEQVALQAQGPHADGVAAAREAAALAERAGDRSTAAECWFVRGLELMRIGEMSAAVGVFDSLERTGLFGTNSARRARVRQYRAFAEEEIGDYGAAMRSAHIAIAEGEKSHGLPVVAYAQMTLAKVYVGLGDVSDAASILNRASSIFARVGDELGRINALSIAAQVALEGGDTASGRAAYDEERVRAEHIGAAGNRADAEDGLADVDTREGRWDDAADWLAAARATMRENKMPGWERSSALSSAILALRRGKLADAERGISVSFHALGPSQHGERYLAAARLAGIHLALGDTARAARELGTADEALDQWRSTLDDREVRILAFQRHAEFGGPDPAVATVIAAVARAGQTAVAFQSAERRRARDLIDQLQRTTAIRTDSTPVPGAEQPSVPRSVDVLTTVQQALPDDRTALVEYAMGPAGAPTTLFVVTQHQARTYILPPADSLADAAGRFTALVESGATASGSGATLGKVLLGSALADLPPRVTRLVIVADGALLRTPFAALRAPGGEYLIERYALSAAPSGLVAAQLWHRPRSTARASVLAFGDPRFASESDENEEEQEIGAARGVFTGTGALPRLRGSAAEARLVARFGVTSVVRLRDSASAAYLKHAALASFRVIHLATHAIVDDQAVTRTALALSPGQGESGLVTPADLAALELRADLVVLSACRAAAGHFVVGEGVRGLTAPLLAAGARAIIASQWEIDDRRTVRLMHDFYVGLADGRTAADALQAAEIDAMRRGMPPREWANFTLTGDPMVRVPLVMPHFDWVWRLLY